MTAFPSFHPLADASRLIDGVVRKLRASGCQYEIDDMRGDAWLAYLEAQRQFDPKKSSFAHHANLRVRWGVLDGRRRAREYSRASGFVAIDPRADVDLIGGHGDLEVAAMVWAALGRLPADERAMLIDVHLKGMSIAESGALIGIGKSWSSRLHSRGMRMLRDGEKVHLDDRKSGAGQEIVG